MSAVSVLMPDVSEEPAACIFRVTEFGWAIKLRSEPAAKPFHGSGDVSLASDRFVVGSMPAQSQMGFVVDKVSMGQDRLGAFRYLPRQ
jgi:hypothetical protein